MVDETEMNAKAEVVALFRPGNLQACQPLKFRFNNKQIEVSEIGLVYPLRKNGALIYCFDVSDGQADYRLELNANRLTWRVTREADHYD